MSGKFTFHSGDYTPEATYLFNERKHLYLQAEHDWTCFYVLDSKQLCIAFVWLHVEKETASSPNKAPFGSLEFIEVITPKVLYDFLLFVENELKQLGVKKIILKNPPDLYQTGKSALLTVLLHTLGFTVSHAEVSSVLKVSNLEYSKCVAEWEIRKLKQAKSEGFSFHQNVSNELLMLYNFIKACRSEKRYGLSMSFQQLTLLCNAFPKKIILFSVRKQNELAAACIAIRISKNILYTFYYDHAAVFNAYSPVVSLIEGIYTYCQQQSVSLLDLGSATLLDGQPNFALLDFKLHLGGVPSAKLTFLKEL